MNKTNQQNITNIPVHNLTMKETLTLINETIKNKAQIHHTVVNAGKIVAMHADEELKESVINADLINADGQAVVWASKILGKSLKERVAGIDLMEECVKLAYKNNYKVFFFGATQEIVEKVIEIYSKKYSSEIIGGYRNGYYDKKDEEEIALEIANSNSNILFVAISSPIKENFLFQNREILKNINFTMGVGGSFDVVAGKVSRAPLWMQKNGLEWLFRVYQEPRRMFKRYLVGNVKFIILVLKYKFKLKK